MKRFQPTSIPYIIYCNKCIRRGTGECPMYFEEITWDEEDGVDTFAYDMTEDNGYCHRGIEDTDYIP